MREARHLPLVDRLRLSAGELAARGEAGGLRDVGRHLLADAAEKHELGAQLPERRLVAYRIRRRHRVARRPPATAAAAARPLAPLLWARQPVIVDVTVDPGVVLDGASRLRVLVEPLELRRALAEVGLDLVVLQHLRA
eukprot:scaffold58131_cov36-Phaeocystis_antarctica.AAC.1